MLQHTARYCNILQHTATPCNTLQHTATHCNTLQHTCEARSTRTCTRNTLPLQKCIFLFKQAEHAPPEDPLAFLNEISNLNVTAALPHISIEMRGGRGGGGRGGGSVFETHDLSNLVRVVGVCCSVLQCGPECCSVLQCVAVCCSVVQCVAVCCRVL